ncbi:alpha/beta fold hydrolase [Sediminibacillus dalangtanensis]|uniref:Alpha/beta fold hydrolase n=1 Tax=Sediminibacillus dalangtanensis TaxID=2729421 RepID=A0ABX7VU41_9BACI|nr:alpha/beta hydrolase [Sediminibacillus dalangtanensis]QTM99519.1 alpha/beta fold hydrolase [Sediminibacillus dalangtanensis]
MKHTQKEKNSRNDFYVRKVGVGKPVVFLPAAGFSGMEGLNIADRLSPSCQSHLLDLPGYGNSKGVSEKCTEKRLADWLKEYLDQQHLHSADIIAHSLGGGVALSFAVHYPERVNRLILLDAGHKSFPRFPFQEFGPFALLFPLLNVGYHLKGFSFMERLTGLFSGSGAKQENEGEKVERFCEIVGIENSTYVQEALRHSPELTASGMNLLFGYYNLNLPKLFRKLTVPTYLIYGTFANRNLKQYKLTRRSIESLQKKQNLPVKYVPVNSGHYVHWSGEEILDKLAFIMDQDSEKERDQNEMYRSI